MLENNRITIAAIFVATYTTLIFSIPRVIPADGSAISLLVYSLFVIFGIIIDLSLFLYLAFCALSLSHKEKKEIFFDIKVSNDQIEKTKSKLFDFAVSLIFGSITITTYGSFVIFRKYFSLFWSSVLFIAVILIIAIVLALIFVLPDKTD